MACGALEGKTWCGYPRKRVLCCSLLTVLIAAAAIITTLVMVLRPPDDIETIEQTESEDALTAGDLTILKTATFPVSDTVVAGTLSLLEVSEDGSFYLALNDFSVSDACNELEVRLSDATSTSTAAASGVLAVPLSVDDASITADFTEPLDADFDVELYDQVLVGTSNRRERTTMILSGCTVPYYCTIIAYFNHHQVLCCVLRPQRIFTHVDKNVYSVRVPSS